MPERSMRAPTAFSGVLRAGEIDQDLAHQVSRKAEELCPAAPSRRRVGHQPDERLIHQIGGLHGVPPGLPRHVLPGQPVELVIHNRRQLVESGLLARTPGLENARQLNGRETRWLHDRFGSSLCYIDWRKPRNRPGTDAYAISGFSGSAAGTDPPLPEKVKKTPPPAAATGEPACPTKNQTEPRPARGQAPADTNFQPEKI